MRIKSSANIIGMMNKEFKLKMVKYFEKDYLEVKDEEGYVECLDRNGVVEDVLSKEEYFEWVNKIDSFGELGKFWKFLGGDVVWGLEDLIDNIEKIKIDWSF